MAVPASRPALRLLPVAAAAFLVAACGPSQQGGGFQGFPPSEVTTLVV